MRKRVGYGSYKRIPWSKQTQEYVWNRDHGQCVYCGKRGQEIDHVVPVAEGGPNIRANAVLACSKCNRKKSKDLSIDMLTMAFYHLLSHNEDIGWLDKYLIKMETTRQLTP